jgi:hypothetical protein
MQDYLQLLVHQKKAAQEQEAMAVEQAQVLRDSAEFCASVLSAAGHACLPHACLDARLHVTVCCDATTASTVHICKRRALECTASMHTACAHV